MDAVGGVDLVAEDEWEAAADLFTGEFAAKSVCARETPKYVVESEHRPHRSARHLHREGEQVH